MIHEESVNWQINPCRLCRTVIELAIEHTYRTRAIITRGLYTFNPIFEVQKRVFSERCMVSIQERFLIKSGL